MRCLFFLWLIFASYSCALTKHGRLGGAKNPIELDTLDLDVDRQPTEPYKPSPQRHINVHHTVLRVGFLPVEQAVVGEATITLSAYFDSVDTFVLDARGFEIKSIGLKDDSGTYVPPFDYDGSEIKIALRSALSRQDTIRCSISYIARPAALEKGNGAAIQAEQGLYFINPRREDPSTPFQIWTQGETENNSGWFPCVDQPNEKFTQEVYITVDSALHTISNGRLVYTELHSDGTKTDYWKQDKPHSTYLVMLAVGEFSLHKDRYEDLDVWYYLDDRYADFAQDIFGNTPEMIGYFSSLLDYPYPWDKYHQVVVRDFVSGAMENTSAVIHGDFVQRSRRELLDEHHEDVIAHELFHHWFGNLVTCESWSQLVLNEGFATYAEYLWIAHKYGLEEARLHLLLDLENYLDESYTYAKPLIRHHYSHPDEVFDGHSYQKGGRVLHLLRKEVGDSAFFIGLHEYLDRYAYQSVEHDQLRQTFEQVTGRDLRWFFDQWFDGVGHPKVLCSYRWVADSGYLELNVEQSELQSEPVYQFGLPISIGLGDDVVLDKTLSVVSKHQRFRMPLPNEPRWYSVDPEGDLLWEFIESKSQEAWEQQLILAPSFISRLRALNDLADQEALTPALHRIALNDRFWLVRQMAAFHAIYGNFRDSATIVRLMTMSIADEKSLVRSAAIDVLDSLVTVSKDFELLLVKALRDSSYAVVHSALRALSHRDPCATAAKIGFLRNEVFGGLFPSVAGVYAACGDPQYLSYFDSCAQTAPEMDRFELYGAYARFALNSENEAVYERMIETLGTSALKENSWWLRLSAYNALKVAEEFYVRAIAAASDPDSAELLTAKQSNLRALMQEVQDMMAEQDGLMER